MRGTGLRGTGLRGTTVVVTGASSGVGRASAIELASRGANVVLVARSPARLVDAERDCRAAAPLAETLVVVADVTDADAVAAVFEQAAARFGRVDAVVHSAATLAYGRFEDVPAEVFDAAVRVTLGGTVTTARAALRHFREHGGGTLVVVGSLLGKIATPFMSTYVTAKWAVHGFVRTLQIESRSEPGISVSLVSPGGVNTPVYRQAGTYLGWHGRPPPPVDSPERVARAVAAAVDRPRRETSVGLGNPLTVLGFRLLPGVYDGLVTPLMRLGGISRDPSPPTPGNVLEPQPSGEAVHGPWGRHWLRPLGLGAAAATGVAWLAQRSARR